MMQFHSAWYWIQDATISAATALYKSGVKLSFIGSMIEGPLHSLTIFKEDPGTSMKSTLKGSSCPVIHVIIMCPVSSSKGFRSQSVSCQMIVDSNGELMHCFLAQLCTLQQQKKKKKKQK